MPVKGTSVLDALNDLRPRNGLAINYRYFGSNWHRTRPSGLVTASYTLCNARLDEHVKTIVNPRKVIKYGNPHFWYLTGAQLTVNEAGRRVAGTFCWEASDDILVVHHYVHKSAEEFLAKARMSTRAVSRIRT